MAQTLLLGLGGTGSRIVDYVAQELNRKNVSINDGSICCAVLDTNDNDRDKLMENGTGIPVIGTSKERIIADYLKMYANKGVEEWMPQSPALLKESMKDGASQMRPKSRLALMDMIESRGIRELENHINQLFNNRDGAKIRVMIVSSLAGGTGSGMFIQTALWIRQYFAKRRVPVTIRGIFVLPDVFVNTIADIREDETEVQSLYANAYGAIRELNAITKIKTKGIKPLMPVKVDGLFDSENGQPDGQPVFDYAFMIDDISEGGAVLTQIDHYEQVVARLIYMQLYAPMHDDLYSEEDNLFKRFQKSPEPVFGSCGTAKASYPTNDIVRYCALRAAQDALSTGWRKIDDEIKDKQRKEDEREKNGAVLTQRISPRAEYIRLFDAKATKSGDQVGQNRLFLNIANDIKNEERIQGADGSVEINPTDKVDDLLAAMDELISQAVDTTDPGALSSLRVKKNWEEQTTDTRETLKTLVDQKEKAVKRILTEVDAAVEGMAEEILDVVFPADMGDVNKKNTASIFGFLTKLDNNNEPYFVHPIAARYLLYKLGLKLEELKASIVLDSDRKCAERGHGNGKPKISFDNTKTGGVEDTPKEYLASKGFLQNEEKFLKEFKRLYAQHNKSQTELCRAYAIQALKLRTAVLMSQRLEKLTKSVEDFFANLVKVSRTLEDELAANIRLNNQVKQKMIYICASEEEKKSLYESLRLNTGTSDAAINEIIVSALYGNFCATENPNAEGNKRFKGKSVENTFCVEVIRAYTKLIMTKHKNDVDLDIYSAVCKSSDIAYDKKQQELEEDVESDRLDIDLETGESREGDKRHARHLAAMRDLADRLYELGSPFLITEDELPEDDDDDEEDDIFTPIKKRKTFWGFHPAAAEKCPELAQILGVNIALQQNRAYAKNELECYRAVYGIQAGYVPKFNELNNGDYYTNYRQVVREMVAGVSAGHPEELIHTPHLDKTWHLFLPYITPEKQVEDDNNFYRMFWLAMAYGMISVNKNGKYQIMRTKKTAAGAYQKAEVIEYMGEAVGKTDVKSLLAALKLDGAFLADVAPLAKKFKEECDKVDTYEGTEFLRGKLSHDGGKEGKTYTGGLATKQDTNAVTIFIRYNNAPKHDDDVTAMLIQTLENLCCELVANKYEQNEQNKIRFKAFELCKRIYTASTMSNKDIGLIEHWHVAWARKTAED